MLLETLHYSNKSEMIPLQVAIVSKNHRMVNLILKYMSVINYACVTQISDIFDDLLIYQGFVRYLEECPFHTLQMINKQTLKVREQEDSDIIATAPHSCSYVDGEFFTKIM